MYFASRLQAGRMLAERLVPKYRYENCAVMALNDGGVVLGAEIAKQLHCILTLLPGVDNILAAEASPGAEISNFTPGNASYIVRTSFNRSDEEVGDYTEV